jgi:putative ABC transport system permease protein
VLLGAAAIVLLIACANLANLILVRADARHREITLRRALGAGRGALAQNLLTETVLLAIVGGAGLGLPLAQAAVTLLVQVAPFNLPRLHEVRLGGVEMVFGLAISIGAGLILGMIPLARHARGQVSGLAASQRGTLAGAAGMRTRHLLMAVQVSLAVLLLSAAGLMVRSFANLLRVDPGFEAQSRLVFRVGLPRTEYRTRPEAASFHAAMLDRLRALPGVSAVAVTSTLPLDGPGLGDPLEVRGRAAQPADAGPIVRSRRVSNGYFAAIGIPLRGGRGFDAADEAGGTSSVVINQALARLYFGEADPTGQQVRPIEGDPLDRWLTIVGVVGNTATDALHEPAPVPAMYVPLRGSMWADVPSPHAMSYVVQTAGSPTGQVPAVRAMLEQLNPRVALNRPERLEDVVVRARASRSFAMVLLVVAAAVALTVGLVGVYAVIAYSVSQRRVEIGLRLAIGAMPSEVTAMIMRESGRVVLAGVALGVAGALATSNLVRALLFGVAPGDLATHLGVGAGLFVVAMGACWWPARMAARLNPTEALRRG